LSLFFSLSFNFLLLKCADSILENCLRFVQSIYPEGEEKEGRKKERNVEVGRKE